MITIIIHPKDYHHHHGYHHHHRHILRAGMRAQGWVQPKAVPQDVIIVVASPLFFIIITIITVTILLNRFLIVKMSEKLCLKWNDFQENVNTAFGRLREEKEFADVTLACEDGQQVEAHKVILAASSPFFNNLLKKNRHPHPLIYLRGAKFEDLHAMVDFLYYGEANVCQENLDSFLVMAEEFKLKGLTGQRDEEIMKTNQRENGPEATFKREKMISNTGKSNLVPEQDRFTSELSQERTLSVQNFVSGDIQELDAKVKSLMYKGQNIASDGTRASICKVCGKEGQWVAIRDHIEANHLEGVNLPCNACGKMFRSRIA